MSTSEMIRSHPNPTDGLDVKLLAEALEASAACATICSSCADACLGEESVADLRDCIRTDLDCADVCATTAAVLSRQTGSNTDVLRAQLEACRAACASCAAECETHAQMHEHCRVCAEACRRCEQACAELLGAL